jgi:hypothetical protein
VVNPANHHLYYRLDAAPWTDSEAESVSLGGHLVTINDEAENDWVTDTFALNRNLWIGFVQSPSGAEPDGGWSWSSGQVTTYVNWDETVPEPNDAGNEDYAHIWGNEWDIHGDSDYRHLGRWNDSINTGTPCCVTLPFGVVEIERLRGDFNGDHVLDADDIDLLATTIRDQVLGGHFDLNGDGHVDLDDHRVWVKDIKRTYFGDADFDGEFNSSDLAAVLAAGQYEDAVVANSGWATGDWNADADFTSRDLVAALQDGGYEAGQRAATVVVPEPASGALLLSALVPTSLVLRRRFTKHVRSSPRWRMNQTIWLVAFLPFWGVAAVHASYTNALIGYWPFDGDAVDHSGGRRDLTLFGNAGFGDGLLGESLDLPGEFDAYAAREIDDHVFDFGGSDFTVQVWVNYNSNVREQTLIEKFYGADGPGWTLSSFVGPSTAHFYADSRAVGLYSLTEDETLGVWRHVVARRTDTLFDLFYDGQLVDTGDFAGEIQESTVPLMIGQRNFLDPRDFSVDGRIDEVAIWNRALSDDEIAGLYNDGNGLRVTTPTVGDLNGNGVYDVADVEFLSNAIRERKSEAQFDVNSDGTVDLDDLRYWVKDIKRTYFGDTDLDGQFSSSDLVLVLAAGQYEDGVDLNSGWDTGDWNADADFTSRDLVVAFQDGGYEAGPLALTRAAAVPEPLSWILMQVGGLCCWSRLRRQVANATTRPSSAQIRHLNSVSRTTIAACDSRQLT